MLHVYTRLQGRAALPPAPPRVDVDKLYIKEALGFTLWNGKRGENAETYLIPMEREGFPEGVIRLMGCTAVPAPYSMLSGMVQSLIRIQAYFGESVVLSPDDASDFVPLHVYMAPHTRMYAQSDSGTYSHTAADKEIHGLLPASPLFLRTFRNQLERVWLNDAGRVQTESGRRFNNVGIIHILRHMLRRPRARHRCRSSPSSTPAGTPATPPPSTTPNTPSPRAKTRGFLIFPPTSKSSPHHHSHQNLPQGCRGR